jgi:hypothetical protein
VHHDAPDVERDPLERIQPFDGDDLLEDRLDLFVHLLEDAEEQVFLGLDVVVEAALEDPELVGDVLDRGRRVPALVEDLGGGLDDLVVALATRARRRGCRASSCLIGCPSHGRRPHCAPVAAHFLPVDW